MSNPRLRFRQKNGNEYPNFKHKKFGDISISHNIRNKKCLDLEIYSINNQIGFVPQSEQFEDAGYLNDTDTSIYMIVPPNHFAYNPARINVGSIGYQNIGYDVQVSSLYEVFKTTNECNDMFVWHWFHTSLFKRLVRKYAEGGVRVYYYYDKLCETPIMLPCFEEQQKIADFLSTVDEVIAQSEAEVSNLQQQKKAAMQKIFSQEVRFKREDGTDYPNWTEKELKAVATILMGQSPSGDSVNDDQNGVPLVQGKADILGYGIIPERYTSNPIKISEPTDIIMTVRAPVGFVAKLGFTACIGRGVCAIRPKENDDYIYYVLQSKESNWKYIEQGSTFTAVNSDDVSSLIISVPCLEEQQKIADFLSAYDEAINYAKQEFGKWWELKKGLLQQMFV